MFGICKRNTIKISEIELFKKWIMDVYIRNFRNQSLTRREYEIVTETYLLIKERSRLTDSYIDVICENMQKWTVD